MICYLIGHKWINTKGMEKKCKRCGKYKIFYGIAESEVYSESIYSEEVNYREEIQKYQESIVHFERIVGDTQLDQIDWIISHSLKSYNEWYSRCSNGLQQYEYPLVIQENEILEDQEQVITVRGGLGNRKLVSWSINSYISILQGDDKR